MANGIFNYEDFAKGTLSGTHDDTTTTFNLVAGHGNRFPLAPARCVIWNSTDFTNAADAYHNGEAEIIEYATNPSANQITGATRGVGISSPITHDTPGKTYSIENVLTAGYQNGVPARDLSNNITRFQGTVDVGGSMNNDGEWLLGQANPVVGTRLQVDGDVRINGRLIYQDRGTLTVVGGAVTISGSKHEVTSVLAANLDTINGGVTDQVLVLSMATGSGDITLRDGVGNIENLTGADRVLNDTDDVWKAFYNGSRWSEIGYTNVNV